MPATTIILKADKNILHLKKLLLETSTYAISSIERKIKLKNIDVLFYIAKNDVIPQLGIGGYTKTPSLVMIPINPSFKNIKKSIKNELPKTLAHELYHAARNYSHENEKTLIEAMLNEGLADHFEIEMFDGLPGEWDTAISNKKLGRLLDISKQFWEKTNYDHNKWFFGSNKTIPKWTGYSLGFCLVGKYLKKHSVKPSSLTSINIHEILR